MTADALPRVLTAAEAMELLRIGRNAFYRAVQRGDLPVIRIGRVQRFDRDALLRLIEGADR